MDFISSFSNNSFTFPSEEKEYTEEEKSCSLFRSLEVLGIRTSEIDDIKDLVIQKFRETIYIDKETARFVVRWPWKHEIDPQQNSMKTLNFPQRTECVWLV